MKKQFKMTLNTIKTNFGKGAFTISGLYKALRSAEGDLPLPTLRWRLHSLKTSGEIEALARGTYALSKHEKIETKLPPELYKISKELQKEFPHARFCVWSSALLGQFMIHQPSVSFNVVEVEKDVLESVFSFLQNIHQNVLLNPDKKEIDHYLMTKTKSIIVKTLIQRAPLSTDSTEKNKIPRLEKILVDLLAEPDTFSMYQGTELKNIWREICHKYSINISTLNNYAKRRNVAGEVDKIIRELGLLTYNQREHS